MANARTRYDALAEYLVRHRDAKEATLYGKPCLAFQGHPFMMLTSKGVAFRLHGRPLTTALAFKGATGFDPLKPDEPPPGRPGWVLVPVSQFVSWDRLAMDAIRCVRLAENQHVSWKPAPPPPEPVAAPPPSTGESLASRVASVLKSGFKFSLFGRE
ncbi:MAG TPA: hypothetical protein VFO79_05155 [Xanthomonadales bacterium]|nr:hypothetical protein [Xanthomonadales bacterium]